MEENIVFWRYYNHALIPGCAPHETANIKALAQKETWKVLGGGTALFARWTSDFDCQKKTNWWYVIKDTSFDINKLKAKRRYEINKGIKNFYVKRIRAVEYAEEIYIVLKTALMEYSVKYRPEIDRDSFIKSLSFFDKCLVYGVFSRMDSKLSGFSILIDHGTYIDFSQMKTLPIYEKFGVNAALVHGILVDLESRLTGNCYICDGSRSILHETNFQDYLEKYFGFRKAYCKLHMKYLWWVGFIIKIVYPFRGILKLFKDNKYIYKLNAVLCMEKIARE